MSAEEIFHQALARPQAERAAFLAAACAGDEPLQRRVETLLHAHENPGSFLAERPPLPTTTTDDPVSERPGTVIGPYKLLEQIGEGGFGVVFMAEQTQPVRRKVALKVLKPGMDTRQVVARFEGERQALAIMDHPNIAKVFDGGATASGRPYFVMELVKGVPVTEFCDQNHLTPRQRLELFIPVCQAVQHAHHKGIIHRDLKPSNILVVMHDTTPVVKVIDFGVAKALGQELTDKTLFTGFAQMIGTPQYMSPEQAGQSGLDIDTRSDIYSLGVLLYELLTSTTPFTKERFKRASYDEIRRIIREEEPPRPSTRLTQSTETLPSVAAQRHTEPAKLTRLVRGELDWMVMKALEKDRNRRYETVNGLTLDVQRYLADETVQACPPSAWYRFSKFARRYRAALSTAALVATTAVVGLTVSTILIAQERDTAQTAARQAQEQRTEAIRQSALADTQAQEAEKERHRAEANLLKAKEAVDKVFTEVAQRLAEEPHMEQIRNALLADALKFYQEFLQQKGTDPAMRHETARAHMRVGSISQMLGHTQRSEQSHRAAIELLEKLIAEFPGRVEYQLDLAASYGGLAYYLFWANRKHDQIAVARKRLALCERLVADFPTVPQYWQQLAKVHTDLANADRGESWEQAEEHFRQASAIWQKLQTDFPQTPADDFGISHTHHWYGALLKTMGRYREAEVELRQALDLRKQLVQKSPTSRGLQSQLAHIENYVGDVLYLTGRPSEAERHYRQAVQIREKLSEDFPADTEHRRRLSLEYADLGLALFALKRTQEAEVIFRRRLSVAKKLVADHPTAAHLVPELAWAYYDLGFLRELTGRFQEAADSFRPAFKAFEDAVVQSSKDGRNHFNLAWVLATCPAPQFRHPGRAVEFANKALQLEPMPAEYWRTLGVAEYRAGNWKAALQAFDESTARAYGRERGELFFLAMTHWQLGDKSRASRLYEQARRWMEGNRPGDMQARSFRDEAAAVLGLENKKN